MLEEVAFTLAGVAKDVAELVCVVAALPEGLPSELPLQLVPLGLEVIVLRRELGVDVDAQPGELKPQPPLIVIVLGGLLEDGLVCLYIFILQVVELPGLWFLGVDVLLLPHRLAVELLLRIQARQILELVEQSDSLELSSVSASLLLSLKRRVSELRSELGLQGCEVVQELPHSSYDDEQLFITGEEVRHEGLYDLVVLLDGVEARVL